MFSNTGYWKPSQMKYMEMVFIFSLRTSPAEAQMRYNKREAGGKGRLCANERCYAVVLIGMISLVKEHCCGTLLIGQALWKPNGP